MGIEALDDYYLGLTGIITVAYQLLFFSIAYGCQFDLLTGPFPRQILVSILMCVWALRLSGFLFYRIIRTGHDSRFDKMRGRFFAFLAFWVFQMLWVWTVSLPVTIGNSPALAAADDDVPFGTLRTSPASSCLASVSCSRHPNYFGDILTQFGIYTIATSPTTSDTLPSAPRAALYSSIVGPFFITFLLLFLSGMPLSERPTAKRRYEKDLNWEAYEQYQRRTSPLFPFPPALYLRLPLWVKRAFFLELPLYAFDPAKHSQVGRGGLNTERRRDEDERDASDVDADANEGDVVEGERNEH
ncbi:unnamed protein product [Parascedosporium putredinis]|uniref:Uncharacterized protein n=1 Tax=Parascedosporium putredinis TaxID=1442378 RepID=A0A9P1MG04_9PEZI|nr:unnamed protein product [Parascedosporium putredinis]CAI8003444.1 unnamed protein product [Parascedosporium putredinis]